VTLSSRPFIVAAIVLAAFARAGGAQSPLAPAVAAAAAGAPVAQAADPLGRDTPAGTVMGFLSAGARGDWTRGARYLDTKIPEARAEELAQQLKVVLDRGLTLDLDRLSRKPEGEQDQRVGKERELLGTIEATSRTLDVTLVRVHYGQQPPVWLFSADTLRGVAALHEEFEPSFFERYLPRSFTQGYGLGYMSWSWSVVAISLLTALIIALVFVRLLQAVLQYALRRFSSGYVWSRWTSVLRPARWVAFGVAMRVLSQHFLTLRQRYVGGRVALVFVVGGVMWLLLRVVGSSVSRWAQTLERQGTTERIALVRLAGRLLQALVLAAGVLALLQTIGINLTPVLAGLGVGGIAVALASQKTLENLFGGMMVIGDSPVRLGNFCRVGAMTGTIEDIGLRSTRMRTVNRTVISIPNADLASQSIENFATRDKLLCTHVLTLRYETTADQLRFVLAGARSLLYKHEKVETAGARCRLVRFAPSGLDVEIFAYLETSDFETFLAIQEDVLLRLMDIIEASGTALAFPSQTMYFARDHGTDRERRGEAEAAVREWRERGTLPFPDLSPDEKSRLDGGVEYPPAGSTLRGDVLRT
jgi:MscS family membrane protein